MEQKKIICKNCGAAMNESDAKCPFCGYINYIGAEEAYMDELYQTEDEMQGLVDDQVNNIKNEVKNNVQFIRNIMIGAFVFLVLIALLIGGIFCIRFIENKIEHVQNVKKIEWQRENFPKLNKMYEEEDLEGIIAFIDQDESQVGKDALYEWEHYSFIICHMDFLELKDRASGELTKYDVDYLLYHSLWYYYRCYESSYHKFTEKELRYLEEEYRVKVLDILHNTFHLKDEDLDEKFNDLNHKDFPTELDYEKCNEYAESIYKNIKQGE